LKPCEIGVPQRLIAEVEAALPLAVASFRLADEFVTLLRKLVHRPASIVALVYIEAHIGITADQSCPIKIVVQQEQRWAATRYGYSVDSVTSSAKLM
jgi:hypothetical protein